MTVRLWHRALIDLYAIWINVIHLFIDDPANKKMTFFWHHFRIYIFLEYILFKRCCQYMKPYKTRSNNTVFVQLSCNNHICKSVDSNLSRWSLWVWQSTPHDILQRISYTPLFQNNVIMVLQIHYKYIVLNWRVVLVSYHHILNMPSTTPGLCDEWRRCELVYNYMLHYSYRAHPKRPWDDLSKRDFFGADQGSQAS